jgi:hypothetical protein
LSQAGGERRKSGPENTEAVPKPSGQEMDLYKAPKAIEMVDMGKDQVKCKLKADKEVKECSVHI